MYGPGTESKRVFQDLTSSVFKLSIVIVTYNPGVVLQQCLDSIPESIPDHSPEIIVVDNASQDGTPERIRQGYPDVHLICREENSGFAAGVNRGLEAAGGEFVLLLNPDVILRPNSLSKMVAFLDRSSETGITGARSWRAEQKIALTAYGSYTPLTVVWKYIGLDLVFPYAVFGRYRHACETAVEPFEAQWVQGSCMMIRRDVIDQIGGFDERFFLFSEETDFCTRAHEAGWRIVYVPQADVTHIESSSVSRYPSLKARHYHLSPLYYFRKRGREGAVIILKIGFTVELILKSAIRLFQWIGGDDQAKTRLSIYGDVLKESWFY